MKIDYLDYAQSDCQHIWTSILINLKIRSPYQLFDKEFYSWLESEWQITTLYAIQTIEKPPIVVGFEMSDEIYAHLLLTYS